MVFRAMAPGGSGGGGTPGADGKTVLNGSGAPGGGVGVDGDFYIDTTADAIYGPKTAGAWGSSTSLIGPAGATGSTGPTGTSGFVGFCGDGNDGNVTISTTVTLVRDMYYSNLTISSGGTLNCGGFRIYVKNTTTVDSTTTLRAFAANGSGTVGGQGTATAAAFPQNLAGADSSGAAGSPSSNAGNGCIGGRGGNGGLGSAGAGGVSGTSPRTDATGGMGGTIPRALPGIAEGFVGGRASTVVPLGGGSGGASGSGGGGNGGAGGEGGGLFILNSRIVVNNGTISANGGNGGNAAGTNAGGGGGGGGGACIINCAAYSGSGTVTANGGTGGTKNGTGVAGSAGTAGVVLNNVWA